jgi:hypothetical protein
MLSIAGFSLTSPSDVTEKTLSGEYTRRSFFVRFERRNQGASTILVVDRLRVLDYDPALRKLTLWYGTPGPAEPGRYVGYPTLVALAPDAVDTVESEVPTIHRTLIQEDSGNLSSITHDLTELTEIEMRILWGLTPLVSSNLDYPYSHILVQDILSWGSELKRNYSQTVPPPVS